jgi:hypothetical protein
LGDGAVYTCELTDVAFAGDLDGEFNVVDACDVFTGSVASNV